MPALGFAYGSDTFVTGGDTYTWSEDWSVLPGFYLCSSSLTSISSLNGSGYIYTGISSYIQLDPDTHKLSELDIGANALNGVVSIVGDTMTQVTFSAGYSAGSWPYLGTGLGAVVWFLMKKWTEP